MEQPNFWFWTSTLTPENTIQQYWPSSWFSSNFPHILSPFFIYKCSSFHIWKCTLDPGNSTPQHHPYLFLQFFPILLLCFIWQKPCLPYLEMGSDPENSRTLQSQKSIYKQKKMPPIVKKITCFFFLKLGPQTLLVVQENLSRTKMYSVVNPWNIFHSGSW